MNFVNFVVYTYPLTFLTNFFIDFVDNIFLKTNKFIVLKVDIFDNVLE